ncbi:MAG: DUF2167 domain-containing protein [Akkermansiaceae bacterium]
MKLSTLLPAAFLCATLALPSGIAAQDTPPASGNGAATEQADESEDISIEETELYKSLGWTTEGTGELESWATIDIPEGFRHLKGADTDKLMRAMGNLPDSYEGLIAVDNLDWFVVFQFEASGYVKDDEKDDLDADALLEQLKDADEASNRQRKSMGLDELNTVGWTIEPRYNEDTNNLEWGLLLRDSTGSESVNFNTKLLGRHGIMHVTLVCDPDQLDAVLPAYQKLLEGYSYKEGKSYGEYEDGDKVAKYGLSALVAGGALYGAAKLGLLAKLGKFWKIILGGIVAVGVAIKKFFGGLFGGNSEGRIS